MRTVNPEPESQTEREAAAELRKIWENSKRIWQIFRSCSKSFASREGVGGSGCCEEAKGHTACVCCVRACVCESNMALKCRSGIISQSAKRCYQDFWGPKFLLALIKNKYANGKWQAENGKWQMASGKRRFKGQPALFNLMSSWILWQFGRKWNEISDTVAAAIQQQWKRGETG